jgi:hypothetical protein
MSDPARIFNRAEKCFQICPSTVRALATKGAINAFYVEKGIFTFSADGQTCCPMIIYPFKRISERTSESVHAGWGIACSDKRWMRAEVFFKYIANVLHPFFVTEGMKLPVVLSLDGCKLHLTFQRIVL